MMSRASNNEIFLLQEARQDDGQSGNENVEKQLYCMWLACEKLHITHGADGKVEIGCADERPSSGRLPHF